MYSSIPPDARAGRPVLGSEVRDSCPRNRTGKWYCRCRARRCDEICQAPDGFERVAVIFPIHVERLMGDAVLVERISVERSGTLEEDDVVVAASQPGES